MKITEKLENWLMSGQPGPCRYSPHGTVIRIPYSPRLDYLFTQDNYAPSSAGIGQESFHYSGIWDRENNILYDPSYRLASSGTKDSVLIGPGRKTLDARLKAQVRLLVEETLADSMYGTAGTEKPLPPCYAEQVQAYTEGGYSRIVAKKLFIKHYPEDPEWGYRCRYTPDGLPGDSLAEYITDPDGYARKAAESYIQRNRDSIRTESIKSDATKKSYRNLLREGPKEDLVAAWGIRRCMGLIPDAKAVNATFLKPGKPGQEEQFRCKADYLRMNDDESCFPACLFQTNKEYHRYMEFAGYDRDSIPSGRILRITYAKRTIYDRSWTQDEILRKTAGLGGLK